MEVFIDIALLALLAVTALAILRIPNLFAVVMLSGIYSLLSAGLFTVMDAMDVAFTEAAVGAGISTVLMLATLALVGSKVKTPQIRITEISAKVPSRRPLFPLVVVLITGAALIMVGVFGGFAAGDLTAMQQFGFGLAAAGLSLLPYLVLGFGLWAVAQGIDFVEGLEFFEGVHEFILGPGIVDAGGDADAGFVEVFFGFIDKILFHARRADVDDHRTGFDPVSADHAGAPDRGNHDIRTAHHRGQVFVLMRLAGLRVHGIYGPSKEETEELNAAAGASSTTAPL